MSAPNIDPRKQRRRHQPAKGVIKGVLVFAALIMIAVICYVVVRGTDPNTTASSGLDFDTFKKAAPRGD